MVGKIFQTLAHHCGATTGWIGLKISPSFSASEITLMTKFQGNRCQKCDSLVVLSWNCSSTNVQYQFLNAEIFLLAFQFDYIWILNIFLSGEKIFILHEDLYPRSWHFHLFSRFSRKPFFSKCRFSTPFVCNLFVNFNTPLLRSNLK